MSTEDSKTTQTVEARARNISHNVRCTECGSQSIEDSQADIAILLRKKAVLEPAMQGRDMVGRAKTGTGKTLAFGIPIMDKIIRYNDVHGRGRNPLALVLAPTRELAKQVEREFQESSPLDTICVYGGVPIQQQMRVLQYGVDVVVGTPGRVIDLLNRGSLVLSEVQFLVLDEADQMLAVGFAEDVEKILDKLPQKRQSMMFSATMPPWIRSLTKQHLKNPVTIDLRTWHWNCSIQPSWPGVFRWQGSC